MKVLAAMVLVGMSATAVEEGDYVLKVTVSGMS